MFYLDQDAIDDEPKPFSLDDEDSDDTNTGTEDDEW